MIYFRHFIALALLTGARKANLASMKWSVFICHDGTWTIPVTRIVPAISHWG